MARVTNSGDDYRPEKCKTTKWLLLDKAKNNDMSGTTPLAYVYQCASLMASQKCWTPSRVQSDWQWFDALCQATIATRGAQWVLENLVDETGSEEMPTDLGSSDSAKPIGNSMTLTSGESISADHFAIMLPLASSQGDIEGVNALLSGGGSPDVNHPFFGNPLYHAVYNDHIDVVKMLEECGADLQTTGALGKLIEVASQRGHADILIHLLDATSERDTESINMCLLYACGNGHVDTVRSLLGWVDRVNETEQTSSESDNQSGSGTADDDLIIQLNCALPDRGTALAAAVVNGNEEIVHMLTVRSDISQKFGQDSFCPLLLAIRHDRGDLLGHLLNRFQVNPNKVFRKVGTTMLCEAIQVGSSSLVRVLLGRSEMSPNYRISKQHTRPLYLAVERGHTEIVKLLLARDDLKPNLQVDKWTPLKLAVVNKNEEIVRLLLTRPDLDPNLDSRKYSDTPLTTAIKDGQNKIVRLLLERSDTDPNLRSDPTHPAPIAIAVEGDHINVVKELLQRKDLDLDPIPSNGREVERTAFLLAVWKGNFEMIRLLRSRSDINVNPHGEEYTAVLAWAIGGKRNGLVKLLLEDPRTDLNKLVKCKTRFRRFERGKLSRAASFSPYKERSVEEMGYGITPLVMACTRGRDEQLKILLKDPRLDVKMTDTMSRSALWWAAYGGSSETFELLLPHCREFLNSPDADGWTPLLIAANMGNSEVIDGIIDCPELEINAVNEDGWTALHLLVEGAVGCMEVTERLLMLKKLLADPRIDVSHKNSEGFMAVDLAQGNTRILDFFRSNYQ
ncbi:unnamed protein product [Clonostachys rosea]|uniref:Uncharacterized protein n=1 Tax=Bionectria ochroleuca TaxID=29856 RepID=A0ABY6U188_BIOOC|nr:unnamed protein product [Clonostachys rosea]